MRSMGSNTATAKGDMNVYESRELLSMQGNCQQRREGGGRADPIFKEEK